MREKKGECKFTIENKRELKKYIKTLDLAVGQLTFLKCLM